MIHQPAVLTAAEFHREAPARPPAHVVVRRGDTLSGIAARYRIEWPGLYEANREVIGADPNLLSVGERLRLPSAAAAVRLAWSYRPPAAVVPVTTPETPHRVAVQPVSAQPAQAAPVPVHSEAPGHSEARVQSEATVQAEAPVHQAVAPVHQTVAAVQTAAPAQAAAPAGSFRQCVISRESGGNAQVMNGSGHYGLYQFSYPAWVASGGSSADFGHASVAEQNRAFATAYAKFGASPWAPYDGC
ncbi:MAG TPA: transglycosylase family protein [Streptosporangiaceae bacterium]|nr:transglycosylase family protein [Streptosporangiaceae bacterium]